MDSKELKEKLENLGAEYSMIISHMNSLKTEFDELNFRKLEIQGAMKVINDLIIECDNKAEVEKDDT